MRLNVCVGCVLNGNSTRWSSMTQILNWYSHIHDCLYCTIVSVNDSLMWALEALAFDDWFVPHGPLAHYHWSKGTRGSLIYLSRHRYFLVMFSRTSPIQTSPLLYQHTACVCIHTTASTSHCVWQLQSPATFVPLHEMPAVLFHLFSPWPLIFTLAQTKESSEAFLSRLVLLCQTPQAFYNYHEICSCSGLVSRHLWKACHIVFRQDGRITWIDLRVGFTWDLW